jgi:hypothetical protein
MTSAVVTLNPILKRITMINRRSFFGFATGGIAAAPLAFIGERASASVVPASVPPKPLVPSQEMVCTFGRIEGAGGDAHIRAMVQEGIQKAMQEYDRQIASHVRGYSMRKG